LKRILVLSLAFLVVSVSSIFAAGEVAIYTGLTQWIDKPAADKHADKYVQLFEKAKIKATWFKSDKDGPKVADWVKKTTSDNVIDALILFGDIPTAIYAGGNTQKDGSLAEKFVETKDGNAIMNHADYMFWGLAGRNKEPGLQNIMDVPGIVMWDDNTPCKVTAKGKDISPTLGKLGEIKSDRPFHVDQIKDTSWKVEVSLADAKSGTRADPVIVRDGDKGRLIPCVQIASPTEPLADIGFEIISWLFTENIKGDTAVDPAEKLSVVWSDLKTKK